MTTIGGRLAARRGIGPGFDFLRLTLAVSIVAWHTDALISGNGTFDHQWLIWFPGYAILTMFFALSGFLIAGSAERLSLGNFLVNRALRIIPALTVEVAFSAFCLGPAFSTLPWRDYISDALTWHYLTNVTGLINYRLPQVFLQHPTSFINLSLWTVPYEYACYAVMSVLMVLGFLRRPMVLAAGAAAIVVVGLAAASLGIPEHGSGLLGRVIGHVFDHVFLGDQSRLFVGFLLGVLLFVVRDRMPYSHCLAGALVVVCLALAFVGPADRIGYPVINMIAAPALVYLTGYIGVSNIPALPLYQRGDYSYGIYLYGFPIQQIIFDLIPVGNPLLQFLLAVPAISVFAALSWHCIEKPILRMRRHFSFTSRMRLAETTRGSAIRSISNITEQIT